MHWKIHAANLCPWFARFQSCFKLCLVKSTASMTWFPCDVSFPKLGGSCGFHGTQWWCWLKKHIYWITSQGSCAIYLLWLWKKLVKLGKKLYYSPYFVCFLFWISSKHQRSWLYWNDTYCNRFQRVFHLFVYLWIWMHNQPSIGLKRTKGVGGFPWEILLRWNCQVCYEHDAHGTDLNFRPATNLAPKIWVLLSPDSSCKLRLTFNDMAMNDMAAFSWYWQWNQGGSRWPYWLKLNLNLPPRWIMWLARKEQKHSYPTWTKPWLPMRQVAQHILDLPPTQ